MQSNDIVLSEYMTSSCYINFSVKNIGPIFWSAKYTYYLFKNCEHILLVILYSENSISVKELLLTENADKLQIHPRLYNAKPLV